MTEVKGLDMEIPVSLSITDRCIVDVSHFVSIIESSFHIRACFSICATVAAI